MHFDSLAGRMLRLPLRFIPRNANLIVLSGVNRGFRWRVGSANHSCWLGHYERDIQRQMSRYVRPDMTCYDIGANAGFYTLAFARLVGPAGHVFAFEPLSENATHIRHHIKINSLNQAEVLEVAVADTDGASGFQLHASPAMGRLNADSALRVSTVKLDTLIRDGRLSPPDFMKMDIEGGELAALRGAEAMLASIHPTMLIAFHGDELFRVSLALLFRHGYVVRDLRDNLLSEGSSAVGEVVAVHSSREASQ